MKGEEAQERSNYFSHPDPNISASNALGISPVKVDIIVKPVSEIDFYIFTNTIYRVRIMLLLILQTTFNVRIYYQRTWPTPIHELTTNQ